MICSVPQLVQPHENGVKGGKTRSHTSSNPHCLHDGSSLPLFHRTEPEPEPERRESGATPVALDDVHRLLVVVVFVAQAVLFLSGEERLL